MEDNIIGILKKVVDHIDNPSVKLVVADYPMIVTDQGETFTITKCPGGALVVESHYTGGRVTNGVSDVHNVVFSVDMAFASLKYNMMHYFSDYKNRLAHVAEIGWYID